MRKSTPFTDSLSDNMLYIYLRITWNWGENIAETTFISIPPETTFIFNSSGNKTSEGKKLRSLNSKGESCLDCLRKLLSY